MTTDSIPWERDERERGEEHWIQESIQCEKCVNPTCHEPFQLPWRSCKIEQVLNGKTRSRTRFDPRVGLISGSQGSNVVGIRRYPDVRGKSERERSNPYLPVVIRMSNECSSSFQCPLSTVPSSTLSRLAYNDTVGMSQHVLDRAAPVN